MLIVEHEKDGPRGVDFAADSGFGRRGLTNRAPHLNKPLPQLEPEAGLGFRFE